MMDWQRKRDPQDVPTPVAVAVADYCRRAKSPASPGLVRDALALLDEADDPRVRELTDQEPTARLGPFALVDVIRGTAPVLAAERQQTGYYEDGRKEAAQQAKALRPALPVLTASSPQGAEPRRNEPLKHQPKAQKASLRRASLDERIAPKKRAAGTAVAKAPSAPSVPISAYLPKHNLPAPRGRFTTIDPSRASFETLFRPDGKEIVAGLIEQVPHRVALLRTLEQGYVGRRGQTLSVGDVEDVLEEHHLFELIEQKEREGVLASVIDQKGSLGRAAHAFGLTVEELEKLVQALGIDPEVSQVRDRFIKEALLLDNLSLRLDLLYRGRYLEDLGIEAKFHQGLAQQLQSLIDEVKDAATSIPTLVDLLSRRHALHAESLRRALEKLGLLEPWLKHTR